jgi:hypothetical protein
MNSFHFRIASFVLAALLGLSGLAMAAGPYVKGNPPDQNPDKQQELVRKLHEDFYKSTDAARRELIAKSRELDAQLYSLEQDEQKIQALAKEVSELRGKLYSARITLKSKLIKEGFMPGYGGRGPGAGGGYGPGMRGGVASCCDDSDPGYGLGIRGYGPGMRGCW